MTHASLCKKTYENRLWLQAWKISELTSLRVAALLSFLVAFAGMLPAITITTTYLPGATEYSPYSVQLEASGAVGTVTWSIECDNCGARPAVSSRVGSLVKPVDGLQLPQGLSLNSATGVISGTPTQTGNFPFIVTATDQSPSSGPASQALSIIVSPCSAALSPASPLPGADVNVAYTAVQFMVTGCPGSYTFSEPTSVFNPNPLPPGFKLTSIGTFSGTPTTVGTFTFPIIITDQNNNQTSFQYSITVNPLPTVSTSSPLPNGPVGVPYSLQISATGGVPPYVFSINDNPPGITITPAGLLNGTPSTPGTYNFHIGVTDSVRGQSVSPFQVTFSSDVPQVQVTPQSLTFNASLNGGPPATQAISIVPASGAASPVTFHVVVDNGQTGSAAPGWITVTPAGNVAPSSVVVSVNQGSMAAGSYPARVQIVDSNGLATDVAVTLNVTSASPQLTVAPSALNFTARNAAPGTLTEQLAVANSGPGTVAFTASVAGGSAWITSVTAGSSSTTLNAPVFVQVQVNTNGLAVGAYQDAILLSSPAGNVQVPVSLFVAASGPILALDSTGVLFQAIEGGGSSQTQTVHVLNLGDPGSSVNWNASLVSAFPGESAPTWLSLQPSNGTATGSAPGSLTLALTPGATQLTPGPYYAIVEVADNNSLNSPQYISAVLNLAASTASPIPAVTPGGLVFTAAAGSTSATPSSQQVQIQISSASAIAFAVTSTTADNGSWLAATPASGTASGQTAGAVTVSVNPSGMVPGFYTGQVFISAASVLESENVTLIVTPGNSSNARAGVEPHAAGCTPSKLMITETGLPNDFAVPAGWPATLIVQLNDDCANPVTNGNVVANFSNGDAPLILVSDQLGNYSATWQPGNVNASMVVTLNAAASGLAPAAAKLYGGIGPNQTPPPVVAPNGTLNNLNPVVGAALSPGTIAQVYGSGLGSTPVSTGNAPLPVNFNETFALIGSAKAPLYFLSSGQINLQIPFEVTATEQLPIVLSVNNALTLPQMLAIVPTTPGVLSMDDGPNSSSPQNGAHIIAQHSSDYSLVTSTNPAKPGEYLIIYLVGMGATNPPVASGAASPSLPPAAVTSQPTVTVGSQPATVEFAGLTPGFVGLYQINFQVPAGAASGSLQVDVSQNGVAANSTLLPVN